MVSRITLPIAIPVIAPTEMLFDDVPGIVPAPPDPSPEPPEPPELLEPLSPVPRELVAAPRTRIRTGRRRDQRRNATGRKTSDVKFTQAGEARAGQDTIVALGTAEVPANPEIHVPRRVCAHGPIDDGAFAVGL